MITSSLACSFLCRLVLLGGLLAALTSTAYASEIQGILRNNEGVRKLESGRRVEAYDRFTDALVDLPFSGEVHYNLGNSFLANKEFEKALNEYVQAIKTSPGDSSREKDVQFKAYFNSAIALTELKKTDEALDLYQKALDLEPDSIEAKTNIELLTQQSQGGGQGDNQDKNKDKKDQKDQKDQKQGEGQDKKDQQKKPENQNQQKPQPTPRPFKSEQLNQQDVSKILEELKRQEEQIRAKMQREGAKDAPRDKDW
jgi:tetratricopeptide (TPR) repeat protein